MSVVSQPMTAEQLAVLADDIADMAECYIDSHDARSLRNAATNLAGMIRRHVTAREKATPEVPRGTPPANKSADG